MNHKKNSLGFLKKPFSFICYFSAFLSAVKNVIFCVNYDSFFNPFLYWGIFSAALYLIFAAVFNSKNRIFLFMFYIIETCARICYSIYFAKCEPRYDILLISLFIVCSFFKMQYSRNNAIYIVSLCMTFITLFAVFYFKYSLYKSFVFFSEPQKLFYAVEIFCNIFITCSHLIIFSFSTSMNLRRIYKKNSNIQKKLEYITCHDLLTGLMNRYRATTFFASCELRKQNENIDYAIAILDIDDFKKINDTYGHNCGDFILKSYTQNLRKKLPLQNKISRWGGEEFIIIFPIITSETIFELDSIRELISLTPFCFNNQTIYVTATYGISSSRHFSSAYEVLNDADSHLLIGKENGKNRLVVSEKF